MNKAKIRTGSAAAAELGVSIFTLRRYVDRGVVVPLIDSAGRKLYTDREIEQIRAFRDNRNRPETPR